MSSPSDLCGRCEHVRDAHRPSCYDDRQGECPCESFVEPDQVELWAATFGFGHPNVGRFVKFEAESFSRAHEIMFDAYAGKWAFVYSWAEFEPQIEAYGLVELPFGENA